MNCLYCNTEVNADNECLKCNVTYSRIKYMDQHPAWVQFYYSPLSITQFYYNNKIIIMNAADIILKTSLLTKLTLTPQNAEAYMNKLLNMKAFL